MMCYLVELGVKHDVVDPAEPEWEVVVAETLSVKKAQLILGLNFEYNTSLLVET